MNDDDDGGGEDNSTKDEGRMGKGDEDVNAGSDDDDGDDGKGGDRSGEDESPDEDILALMKGKDEEKAGGDAGKASVPAGVDPEQWKAFQSWRELQQNGAAAAEGKSQEAAEAARAEAASAAAAASAASAAAAASPPEFTFTLNPEEFDEAGFISKTAAESAIKRAALAVLEQVRGSGVTADSVGERIKSVQEEIRAAQEQGYYQALRGAEFLLHVKDASAENPQLFEHPEAFQTLLHKNINQLPNGDPREIVEQTVQGYLRAYRVKHGVEETQRRGRRVDVRPGSSARGGRTLPRQGSEGKGEDERGLGTLMSLYPKEND